MTLKENCPSADASSKLAALKGSQRKAVLHSVPGVRWTLEEVGDDMAPHQQRA